MGFLGVGIITLVVGFTGWYGIHSASAEIEEIGHNNFPAIDAVLNIRIKVEALQTVFATISNTFISEAEYQTQLSELAKIRNDRKATMDAYEATPFTPDEVKVYKEFTASLDNSVKIDNDFLDLVKRLRTDGTKPEEATKRLTQILTEGDVNKAFDELFAASDKHVNFISGLVLETRP